MSCVQGAPKKLIPYEKFDISGTVVIFSPNLQHFQRRIQAIYPANFIALQISLQYLDAFKNYNYLNLNVHFSKWTSN